MLKTAPALSKARERDPADDADLAHVAGWLVLLVDNTAIGRDHELITIENGGDRRAVSVLHRQQGD